MRRDEINRKTDKSTFFLVTKEVEQSDEGNTAELEVKDLAFQLASQLIRCVILGKSLNLSES